MTPIDRAIRNSNLGELQNPFNVIHKTCITSIWVDFYKRDHYIFSLDPSKFLYYQFAVNHGFKYIPKLYGIMQDALRGLYCIHRAELFPVVSTKKLARIEKIKDTVMVAKVFGLDPIADELLSFYYEEGNKNVEFDLGPHFIMQNARGKLVVSDAFIQKASGNIFVYR